MHRLLSAARVRSPPSRAAWIEICPSGTKSFWSKGRRLHGRRGLKFVRIIGTVKLRTSPPSRAAWIEILNGISLATGLLSPPSRAAWIEIAVRVCMVSLDESPPSRAAWIEISKPLKRLCNRTGRRLHGRRGLKLLSRSRLHCRTGRRLHGRRGLKWRR